MLLQTHVLSALLVMLFLLDFFPIPWLFLGIALISCILPDLDMGSFFKHRGMLHSFTFCGGISLLLFFVNGHLAASFAIGYGIHLIGDSLTIGGLRPFWPSALRTKGLFKVGSTGEKAIFYLLFLAVAIKFFFLIF